MRIAAQLSFKGCKLPATGEHSVALSPIFRTTAAPLCPAQRQSRKKKCKTFHLQDLQGRRHLRCRFSIRLLRQKISLSDRESDHGQKGDHCVCPKLWWSWADPRQKNWQWIFLMGRGPMLPWCQFFLYFCFCSCVRLSSEGSQYLGWTPTLITASLPHVNLLLVLEPDYVVHVQPLPAPNVCQLFIGTRLRLPRYSILWYQETQTKLRKDKTKKFEYKFWTENICLSQRPKPQETSWEMFVRYLRIRWYLSNCVGDWL